MNKKQQEDQSLTLKVKEWQNMLASSDIKEVKRILRAALARKDEAELNKVLRLNKAKELSRKRLKDKAEDFRSDLIKKQTHSEVRMKVILKELNVKYEFQKIFYTEKSFYIVDFYLPDYNVAIEVDGGYHNDKEQKIKDNNRTLKLTEDINHVYRIKNESVDNIEIAKGIVGRFIAKAKEKLINERTNTYFKNLNKNQEN